LLLIALALGCLTTWLTAWGFSLLESHLQISTGGTNATSIFPAHQIRTDDGDVGLDASTHLGYRDVYTRPRWTISDPAAFDPHYPTPDHVELAERKIFGEPPWPLPSWAILPRAADTTLLWNATHAYGWPMPAAIWLQEQRAIPGTAPRRMTHAIRFGRMVSLPFTQTWEAPLPLRPIPTGMAVDTAFYGSAWWALMLGCVTTRAHLRRRHNLCPTCAYDRQGLPPLSPCPECGRA
jgi:hypothetical protein